MGLSVVRTGFTRAERIRFLEAGREVYADDPHFVAELRRDLLRRTDPRENPFFAHAEVDHLVAVRDGRDVGRIAAIRNLRSEEFRGDRTGWFGWFESANDPAVATALVDAARERLAARGCDRLVGPASYSTNDTCGLLVEGFDGPPALMMAYNPPWYEALLLGTGLAPSRDLLAWDLDSRSIDTERFGRITERAQRRHGWSIRPLSMRRFEAELGIILDLYNRAWESNWGFVPMTPAEIAWLAAELKPVIVPDLVLIAERDGEPLGFALSLPDLNQVLRHLDGRLLPFGWLKALWWSRRVDRMRVLALGILPEVRNQGVDAGLYLETMKRGVARGYPAGECSWTLAENDGINRAMKALGAQVYRRYRLFEGPTRA